MTSPETETLRIQKEWMVKNGAPQELDEKTVRIQSVVEQQKSNSFVIIGLIGGAIGCVILIIVAVM